MVGRKYDDHKAAADTMTETGMCTKPANLVQTGPIKRARDERDALGALAGDHALCDRVGVALVAVALAADAARALEAQGARLIQMFEDLGAVSVDVTDGYIELCQNESQGHHISCWALSRPIW